MRLEPAIAVQSSVRVVAASAAAKGIGKGDDPRNRPGGNLPPPPEFNGDVEDPKVYRRYKAQVENWVLIAKNIIEPEEMGPRLFGALKDKAFDHVEDESPSTFAVKDGVDILLQKLAYFDQRPTVKPIKEQAATLFPLPLVPRNKYQGDKKFKPQYHNVHMTSTDGQREDDWPQEDHQLPPEPWHDDDYQDWPCPGGDGWNEEDYNDDYWSEHLPEALARNIHAAYVTFKQAHDRLNQANRARGYYNAKGSGKASGKGKSGKGFMFSASGKGKGKGRDSSKGQARRGMSLDDFERVTNCSARGEMGHWAGDRQCTAPAERGVIGIDRLRGYQITDGCRATVELLGPLASMWKLVETSRSLTLINRFSIKLYAYAISVRAEVQQAHFLAIDLPNVQLVESQSGHLAVRIDEWVFIIMMVDNRIYFIAGFIGQKRAFTKNDAAMVVVACMFEKSRRQKLAKSVFERRFPVMKILTDPALREISSLPDTRSGSSTRMAYFPNISQERTHPDSGEHVYTVPAGKFMECLCCGKVWKAAKYPVTVNHGNTTEAIFWNYHGARKKPGDRPGESLSAGQAKRYFGMAKTTYQNIILEKDVYDKRLNNSKFPRRSRRGFDLFEVFGGECGVAIHAADQASGWRMRALQPVDKLFGQDLKIQKQRQQVLETIDKWKPRLVIIQLPCTLWTLLNRNINYRDNTEVLERLRDEERCFLQFTRDIFNKQKHHGNRALLENPATADSWREDVIMELRRDNYECTSNMCMFGMIGKDGPPMKKLVRWLGTHPLLTQPRWRVIMNGVVDIMSRRSAGSANVAKDSEMWEQVDELVPWQILSIQPRTNQYLKSYNLLQFNGALETPAKIPYIGSFNLRVGLDFFGLMGAANATHLFLSILEMSGLLMVVAHWQSGRAEANITLWRHMAKRAIDDMQLIGPDDKKMLTAPINQSRIPGSITDPANSAVVHSAMTGDAELAERARVLTLADLAFTEYDRSESLKRSMLRLNRPCRGDYTAGDRVAFWRLPKTKKGKHYPARFIVATVIGPGGSGGPDDNNVWVQSSGHPILVSKEQLREARGTEMWAPDDADLAELRRAAQ
ncbi:unnamed protein product, partial [Prorocentrum cordatum]